MVAECRLFNFVFVFNFTQFFCQDSSVIQRLCFLIQLQRVKETALWEIEILQLSYRLTVLLFRIVWWYLLILLYVFPLVI